MRLPIAALLGAAVFFLAGTATSHAWSGGGHKVVALIAWRQLDPATRDKVAALLQSHPRWQQDFTAEMPQEIASGTETERQRWLFAQAAIWPDKVRNLRAFHHKFWHFINEPVFLSDADAAALGDKLSANREYRWSSPTNAETQNAPQTVDRALKVLKDPAASSQEKALMLSWLLHVVGDLHQPMHCVSLYTKRIFPAGDQGGNSIELSATEKPRRTSNIHAFWDRLLKADVSLNEASATAESILADEQIVKRATASASILAPERWVSEGRKIASADAYTETVRTAVRKAEEDTAFDLPRIRVSMTQDEMTAYGKRAGAVASERAAIAGYRLAELLRQALK